MKKLLMLSMLLLPVTGFSVQIDINTCDPNVGSSQKDEYIYTSEEMKDRGCGWECGASGNGRIAVAYGDRITMPAGHYWDGEIISKQTVYECKDDGKMFGDNIWRPIGAMGVADEIIGSKVPKADGSNLTSDEKRFICISADQQTGSTARWDESAVDCTCPNSSSARPMRFYYDLRKCLTNTEYCEATRKTDEGKACCHVSGAKWNGKNCVCNTPGMKFELNKKNLKLSRCVSDGSWVCPDKDFSAELQQCASYEEALAKLRAKIAELSEFCAGKKGAKNQTGYVAYIEEINKIVVEECNGDASLYLLVTREEDIISVDYTGRAKEITDLELKLKAVADTFGPASVWRDADGNFNTARLASDSIAAVVLGTTGGVVTSTVMKKKQVESGFEEIQCTIGGQVVATWGDQFSVGIQ